MRLRTLVPSQARGLHLLHRSYGPVHLAPHLDFEHRCRCRRCSGYWSLHDVPCRNRLQCTLWAVPYVGRRPFGCIDGHVCSWSCEHVPPSVKRSSQHLALWWPWSDFFVHPIPHTGYHLSCKDRTEVWPLGKLNWHLHGCCELLRQIPHDLQQQQKVKKLLTKVWLVANDVNIYLTPMK